MSNKLRILFGGDIEEELKFNKLSDCCPCDTCPKYKKYKEALDMYWITNSALYGGEEVNFSDYCNKKCLKLLDWEIDCADKLKWYEDNDERLNK